MSSNEARLKVAKYRIEQTSEMISRLRVAIRQRKPVTDEELWKIQLTLAMTYDVLDETIPLPDSDESVNGGSK